MVMPPVTKKSLIPNTTNLWTKPKIGEEKVSNDLSWAEQEFARLDLGDKRLNERLIDLANKFAAQPQAPINQACEDWADTKGAYRLFNNEKVTSDKIFLPHQERTVARMSGHSLIFAVQDTVLFNYTAHPKTSDLGPISDEKRKQQGLVMHHTLVLTEAGMPLGRLTQSIWARAESDESSAAERRNRPIEEKESYKWLVALEESVKLTPKGVKLVNICDRESDVYEYMSKAEELKTNILLRAAQNRCLDNETAKLWDFMAQRPLAGELFVNVSAKNNQPARMAKVAVRFSPITLRPPHRPASSQHKPLKPLKLHAVWVKEIDPPSDVDPLEWMLLTNVPVKTLADAIKQIKWYGQRWHIEVYHKVLKSGCTVEDCRLQTADRLQRYLTLFGVVAWRVYWITHLNRHQPEAPCTLILTTHEWEALYCTIHHTTKLPKQLPTVRQAVRWIGQLGGFLGRKRDGEPGVTVIWRGWQRLSDIAATWLLLHPKTTCG